MTPTEGGGVPEQPRPGDTAGDKLENLQRDASGRTYSDTGDDATERLEYMDQEGIDVQIIFPGASRATLIPDPDVSAAARRAVNQWNAEFASAAPRRLKPSMVLPMRHPDQALEEFRYATSAPGLKSVFVARTPPPERRWSDPGLMSCGEPWRTPGPLCACTSLPERNRSTQPWPEPVTGTRTR